MKYKLKDDWYFGTYKVRSKGDIIEFDENLEFEFSYMNNTIKISSNPTGPTEFKYFKNFLFNFILLF